MKPLFLIGRLAPELPWKKNKSINRTCNLWQCSVINIIFLQWYSYIILILGEPKFVDPCGCDERTSFGSKAQYRDRSLRSRVLNRDGNCCVDEEHASAWGKTDISRKLAIPHRALRTTRQSNTCTTALIFRVFCEVGRRALRGFYLNVGLFNMLYWLSRKCDKRISYRPDGCLDTRGVW